LISFGFKFQFVYIQEVRISKCGSLCSLAN